MRGTARLVTSIALAAGIATLASACGTSAQAPRRNTSHAATSARVLPSPFKIVARYSANSLGLNNPDALAIGSDGNLYVTDMSQRVSVISPSGRVLRRWGQPGSGPGDFKFIAWTPSTPTDIHGKIAIGPRGDVYVSDSGNYRVQVFTPQGRFIRQFGRHGSGKGRFLSPFDLVVDKAGNVYVVDLEATTLTKFSPAGKVIWQLGGPSASSQQLAGSLHVATIDPRGRLVIVNDALPEVLYLDPSGHVVDSFSPATSYFPGAAVCEASVDAKGNTFVTGCAGFPTTGPTLVYNATHKLIAEWPGTLFSLRRSPVFGPHGEVFALATNGSILKLRVLLPGS